METDNENQGGRLKACSPLDRRIARPIKVSIPEQINDCPECHGKLKYGSRDLAEGDMWWCSVCGYGPIKYPLFGGPEVAQITKVKELLGIIDADKANEALRIVAALKKRPIIIAEEPVPGYQEPSPHPFLDNIVTRINEEQAVVRKVTSHVK